MGLNVFGSNITIPGMPGSGYGDPGVGGNNPLPGSDSNSGEQSLSEIAAKVIQQATQGASGASAIVSRPQVMLPQPVIKPQIPLNQGTPPGNVQATTHAGQRRNDINNLFQSVGNIVKTGINAKRQKDERDIMSDLAIIQAAASQPDDPHNKEILNKMANDPKVVKRLQKALGYNPLSGDAPGPETQAMMKYHAQVQMKTQAREQAQARVTDAMKNLMSRMPNTQQINPVVSMQAELIKAGILPKNDMSPKALLDFVTEAMKDKTKQQEILERAKATNNQTLMRLYETIARANAYLKGTEMRTKAGVKEAEIRAGATRYGADRRFDAVREAVGDRDRTIDNLKKVSDAYENSVKNLDVAIARALKQSQGKETDEVKRLKEEQKRYKSLKDGIDNTMKDYKSKPLAAPLTGTDELDQQLDPSKVDEMNEGDFIWGTGTPNNPSQ